MKTRFSSPAAWRHPALVLFSMILLSMTSMHSSSAFVPLTSPSFQQHQPRVRNQEVSMLSSNEDVSVSSSRRTAPFQPTPVIAKWFQDTFTDGKNPATWAATACLLSALCFSALPANAAMSGGRLGGSYASPARVAPSLPSRSSYSGGSSYNSYGGSSFYSSPRVISPIVVAPSYGGAGVMTTVNRGPGIFDLFFYAAVGGVLFSFVQPKSDETMGGTTLDSALGAGTTVASVSLALSVPDRDNSNSILSLLNRLGGDTSKTGSRMGLANLTSQVALELLRRVEGLTGAHVTYQHYGNNDFSGSQRRFNQVAVQERSKFQQETVAKYGGVDYSDPQESSQGSNGNSDQATMAVVTIVLHLRGDSLKSYSDKNTSVSNIKALLTQIASDVKVDDCLQGAEILWTPGDRAETLSPRDVVADYPELRSL